MNEEICYITNPEKSAKNDDDENDDCNCFLRALGSIYEKIRTNFFHAYLLACLKKKIHEFC